MAIPRRLKACTTTRGEKQHSQLLLACTTAVVASLTARVAPRLRILGRYADDLCEQASVKYKKLEHDPELSVFLQYEEQHTSDMLQAKQFKSPNEGLVRSLTVPSWLAADTVRCPAGGGGSPAGSGGRVDVVA